MSARTRSVAMRGMSLVELMVAMAIGIFLLAGAVTVFGKTRDLYRTNDGAARLQETARYAMSTIEADLRMANFWGFMTRPDLVTNGPQLDLANPPAVDPTYALPADMAGFSTVISSCGAMWAVKLPAYVEANDDVYGFGCAAFGSYRPGTDQLVVRRAATDVITNAQLGANNGRLKIRATRSQAALFAGTALPPDVVDGGQTRALVAHGYYIDQSSDMDAAMPSLRRKQLGFAGNAPVILDREIVPGVEDLQIEYGADLDNDQNADYFVQPGTAIPIGDQIVAVRVWLLVRAEQPELAFTDTRTYDYASRTGAAAITPNDAFRRVLTTKTIALRNARR